MWAKRFGWLALLWLGGVVAVGAIALLIRVGMNAAGLSSG